MALATAAGVMGESRNDRTRWPKQSRLFTVKRAPTHAPVDPSVKYFSRCGDGTSMRHQSEF